MRKFYILGLIGLAVVIIGLAWAEQITFTTYYPAPYGVYKEFKTTSLTLLATDSDNVGIGIETPDANAKLEVQGGAIMATGGLIIQTTQGEDPDPLTEGQIWLDLNP